MKSVGIAVAATFAALSAASAAPKDIELLRPADVAASAPALAVVKKALEAKSFTLHETAVPAGDNAIASAIADAKIPPAAALVNGYEMRALADQRKLADITGTAQTDRWLGLVMLPAQPYLVFRDRWFGAALDLTPLNGLWTNAGLMDKIGGVAPDSVDALFALLDRARQAGVAPLAISGAPRDLALLFEELLTATAGPEVYKRVFFDANDQDLHSDALPRAFDELAHLRSYVAAGNLTVDARTAAEKVAKGEALAVAGPGSTRLVFAAEGKVADKDYHCLRFPGSAGAVLFQMDIFAMLKSDADAWPGQSALAEVIMDPKVQVDASLASGAVPVRASVDTSGFDTCASQDVTDVGLAAATSSLLGSTAYGFTERASTTAAYIDVVAKFYRGEIKTSEEAAQALVGVLTAAR